MYFTKNKSLEFERMMREVPGFNFKPKAFKKERDCVHCLYFCEKDKTCSSEQCIAFKAE